MGLSGTILVAGAAGVTCVAGGHKLPCAACSQF